MLLFLALACTPEPQPVAAPPSADAAPSPHLRFVASPARPSDDGVAVLASARQGERVLPLRWIPLLVQGRTYGDGPPFGTLVDHLGQPLPGTDSCNNPDYNGVLEAAGRTWMLTHLECSPAALVVAELGTEPDGTPVVLRAAPADVAPVGGLNQLCSGDVTPWGTLLSGEEFETDAGLLVDGAIPRAPLGIEPGRTYTDHSRYRQWARFQGPEAAPSPYGNGWMVETRVLDAGGATTITRRLALGRVSHELGLVMPDQRTIYMTDDHTHTALLLFVADQAGDLSAGTLYAARWQAAADGTHALTWHSLGHATDAEIQAALDAGVAFSDLYQRTAPGPDGSCPAGSQPNRGPQRVDECLAPVPGSEEVASRLETRRAAALAGATTELEKAEGLALDPDGRVLYLATTRVGGGMLAGDPPWPERDHLALAENPCGVVWGLDLAEQPPGDSAGRPIDSAWVATTARVAVAGRPDGEGCAPDSISEPDNLAFLPVGEAGQGILLIAEDTDRSPNLLWAWQEGALVPLLAAPPQPPTGRLAEVSGLSYVPAALGAGWITVSIQHPGGQPAVAGLLGPLPASP